MRVLLFQLDGRLPNIALMRIASQYRSRGAEVELRRTGQPLRLFNDDRFPPDRVYGSAIFTKSLPTVERLRSEFPGAIIGGTGVNITMKLEDIGVHSVELDYSIYPQFRQSIGFTQRGCRLKCGFCVVPRKEGSIHEEQTINELWRGKGYPRELILLDNDFFGAINWRDRIREIREGGFRINFNQGINARFLTDEAAEAVASIDYRAVNMITKRIYTAWDNKKDEDRLFAGLNRLVRYGVKPRHIMVYILVGYWPGETDEDRIYRVKKLRDFGADPYPMPFARTPELVGFQRWVLPGYDKRIPWKEWKEANCQPRQLGRRNISLPLFSC